MLTGLPLSEDEICVNKLHNNSAVYPREQKTTLIQRKGDTIFQKLLMQKSI